MPEGDTAHRAAGALHDALAGKTVTRFELRVPGSATADLRGEVVHDVVARGKHILERIGEWTLHSHMKMEGRWDVYPRGARWRRPSHTARALVGSAGLDTVGFDLAGVELVPTSDERRIVGHLGPDPLSPDWDLAEAARRIAGDVRPVHVAVLDQRNVAGFGNVYANEMLFVRGIAPARPAAEVEAPTLLDVGARMMRANLHRPERTFTGDTRPGRRTWVYGREGRPCHRCGTVIRTATLGASPTSGRNVFWCPRCQT